MSNLVQSCILLDKDKKYNGSICEDLMSITDEIVMTYDFAVIMLERNSNVYYIANVLYDTNDVLIDYGNTKRVFKAIIQGFFDIFSVLKSIQLNTQSSKERYLRVSISHLKKSTDDTEKEKIKQLIISVLSNMQLCDEINSLVEYDASYLEYCYSPIKLYSKKIGKYSNHYEITDVIKYISKFANKFNYFLFKDLLTNYKIINEWNKYVPVEHKLEEPYSIKYFWFNRNEHKTLIEDITKVGNNYYLPGDKIVKLKFYDDKNYEILETYNWVDFIIEHNTDAISHFLSNCLYSDKKDVVLSLIDENFLLRNYKNIGDEYTMKLIRKKPELLTENTWKHVLMSCDNERCYNDIIEKSLTYVKTSKDALFAFYYTEQTHLLKLIDNKEDALKARFISENAVECIDEQYLVDIIDASDDLAKIISGNY